MAEVRETLSATDDPYIRAQKAWKILGFTNDRLGLVGTLAEVFMLYRDLDIKENKE